MAIEISEVRRRLRSAIEEARRHEAARRGRRDAAARDYEQFLSSIAIPVVQAMANALSGEGHQFRVETPSGSVRLTSGHSNEDFIEITLDTSQDPPEVVGRTSRGRGRRMIATERPVRDRTAVAELNDEDVLAFLLTEIIPFLSRR
ncbi:MAG TPA: hypothetical protein VM364_01155 [Vicinamibacterales bacterium]|nr:hypothetical protein [Vicinamibacterales bacterium]